MESEITALIPARKGSLRVPNKNIELLDGHPMIAYSISSALKSQIFKAVIVASDGDEICAISKYYGATEVVKRNTEDATSTSPDISWLKNLQLLGKLQSRFFAILRPTSPLRSIDLIKKCTEAFINSEFDSLRTVKKVADHPGKMWHLGQSNQIFPYLIQPKDGPATHALQYQSLEEVYVQTSVFEIAKTSVIAQTDSREGKKILGYVTTGIDSFSVDSPDDLEYLKYLSLKQPEIFPQINSIPFKKLV